MTDQKLRTLIAQAIRLDRGISQAEDKLKGLKAQIAAEAETRPDEQIATEGGGTSITFEGAGGCIARVTRTAAALKSAVSPTDKKFAKIKELTGTQFPWLFQTAVVHTLVPDFRKTAANLMGDDAKKLIKLCENPGKTTVSFETKEVATAAA